MAFHTDDGTARTGNPPVSCQRKGLHFSARGRRGIRGMARAADRKHEQPLQVQPLCEEFHRRMVHGRTRARLRRGNRSISPIRSKSWRQFSTFIA